MRHFQSSLAIVLALLFALSAAPVVAQEDEDKRESETSEQKTGEEDKAASDGTKTDDGSSHLSIKIDSQGIRIEGDANGYDLDTLGADEEVYDDFTRASERHFREKGADIVKFGENLRISPDELVRGDVVVFGGEVIVEGKVVGNIVVISGNADLRAGAEVNGDVVVLGGVLDEEPEAVVQGERVEFTEFALPAAAFSSALGSHVRVFEFLFVPIKFFISIILSFLIVLFLRDRVVRTHQHVIDSVMKSFGTGFLVVFVGMFLVAVLTVVLLVTLIGIPLALVLVVSCVVVFIISYTVAAYSLGTTVNRKMNVETLNPFAIVLVGTAVLYLPALIGYGLSMLPVGSELGSAFKVIGAMISAFAYLVGIGGLFLSRFGSRTIAAADDPTPPEGVAATQTG